jgi:hypothetical protein
MMTREYQLMATLPPESISIFGAQEDNDDEQEKGRSAGTGRAPAHAQKVK